MSEMEQLKSRMAALEAKLAAGDEKKDEDDGKTLAAEIDALEAKLAAEKCDDEKEAKRAADEKKEDEPADEKKASEVDPSGVEEEITQDKFTEVEKLRHGEELATGPSMGAVAPTRSEYVARMKMASARLDRVADYLERNGRRELAFRIDRIADAIDAKVKGGK